MTVALRSWRDRAAKHAILDFVGRVTTPGDGFVEPAARIATFDNDGTLWCEKPMYVQADFVLRRWAQMVKEVPRRPPSSPTRPSQKATRPGWPG